MSAMFEIEKDVPLPLLRRAPRRKYPWSELGVGDSFFVPGVKSSQISGAIQGGAKATGRKFAARTLDGGTRIWRLPDGDEPK